MSNAMLALRRFQRPDPAREHEYMMLWNVPETIQKAFAHVRFTALGTVGFPTRIYCNKIFQQPLQKALENVISRGLAAELKSWDGCYIIRVQRGSDQWSMHAWGLAIDVNAAENRMGRKPRLSAAFVKCFTDAGLIWGGHFPGARVDGMHFELQLK